MERCMFMHDGCTFLPLHLRLRTHILCCSGSFVWRHMHRSVLLPPKSLLAVDLYSCATLPVQPVPSRINALKPAALNTKQGFGLHLQRRCAEQIACGHSPRCTPIASHRNAFFSPSSLRTTVCYLIAAPATLSWRGTQPAEARSVSSAPRAPTCKIYDCSKTQKKSGIQFCLVEQIQVFKSQTPISQDIVQLCVSGRRSKERGKD